MRILIVASYNKNRYAQFIVEQAESLHNAGCEIEWFGIIGKGVIGYLRELPRLRKKIQDVKPDIIHAHYGLTCLLANLATRRVPVVSTYHGSDINEPRVLPFSKMAMRLSAWNIFVSKRNVDIAKPKRHWSLIPCGVNMPQSWSELQKQNVEQLTLNQWVEGVLNPNKKHVLFAGAFDNPVKDPELAIDAIASLNEKINIDKHSYADINRDKDLTKKDELLHISTKNPKNEVELIELKGYNREQVNALMYSCDALLMTSKTEGSPQVIKEAMACGCPIVSVDVGDVAERTEGVEGCYIVPTREPKDIAEKVTKAIAFNGKTDGRKKILECGLTNELVAKKIIEIYEDIMGK